ncbi:DUF937 domain-containing protein [Gordonia soli]|uniref:DUF937 domain-containing protein n=1 Tax=Gordonia soli NBRC 108243 TaxID=1223545 RepID=M0QLT8_9ACTN|nr:DUF937 domain-containing protein [Gordonia soli]GAC69276.1 hypothetical protein GS4_23_00730 [Gordonia soli NBRC 108243]
MPEFDDLISRLPIADIAGRLGVDEATAQAAVEQAVPGLLTGLEHQTTDEGSAQQLAGALDKHTNDLADGEIRLDEVDTADGSKIVGHIFGGRTDDVAHALSGAAPAAAVDPGLIKKLLPILAPIVLSYLTQKVLSGKGSGGAAGGGNSGGAGDLGSILGGALGGSAAGGLGGVLGSILGGASTSGGSGGDQKSGGGLGGLLGSILGGR